jgi:signal transduction histidine kinase
MTASGIECPALLSLAVHELRTPVAVATGYLRMLLQFHGGTLTADQQKFVAESARSCARSGELLAELSDLASLLTGPLALGRDEVSLFAVVADVVAAIPLPEDRGVHLELRGATASARMNGDADRLRGAFRSVIAATLRERVRPGALAVECRIRRRGRSAAAVIAIGDDPAAATLAALTPARWAPFDLWRGGVGFSLPIAARIIELHGGRLGSLPGSPPRSAVALALPVRE